jgi:DNA-binding MarR family transcriptional regulator
MQDSYQLHGTLSASRLVAQVRKMRRARASKDQHVYFRGVANARYVLRKVFRIIEEQAKANGLDPLAHQALLQIYGSENSQLRVKELAERLDVSPAFCSSLVGSLVSKGLAARASSEGDLRATIVQPTDDGMAVLRKIDNDVKVHVDYFNHGLSDEEREMTIYVMMFYVGVELEE